ncbi:MAG: adenine phosphoribosyltransferase [SAR324 cluster bacterium]|nr:adenine phosphoribosyltransferase [SAR324 cluster bacterium]
MQDLKSKVRTIMDFPKPGIQFRDITTLLADPEGLKGTIDALADRYQNTEIDAVAGIEARGFTIGAALAYRLNTGFLMIRKPGKLPGETIGIDYELEYGSDRVEIHVDSVAKNSRILMIDDLLATGGTMEAACRLIEKAGGNVVECAFVIDLPDLGGNQKLSRYPVFSLINFEGE